MKQPMSTVCDGPTGVGTKKSLAVGFDRDTSKIVGQLQ
jgi:hypothetical protein